jgi:hypothetical protein
MHQSASSDPSVFVPAFLRFFITNSQCSVLQLTTTISIISLEFVVPTASVMDMDGMDAKVKKTYHISFLKVHSALLSSPHSTGVRVAQRAFRGSFAKKTLLFATNHETLQQVQTAQKMVFKTFTCTTLY